jgi:hypothetical protein
VYGITPNKKLIDGDVGEVTFGYLSCHLREIKGVSLPILALGVRNRINQLIKRNTMKVWDKLE